MVCFSVPSLNNGNQEVFRRIEKKYIVDEPTYEKLIKKLNGHFVKDRYYKSTILKYKIGRASCRERV